MQIYLSVCCLLLGCGLLITAILPPDEHLAKYTLNVETIEVTNMKISRISPLSYYVFVVASRRQKSLSGK